MCVTVSPFQSVVVTITKNVYMVIQRKSSVVWEVTVLSIVRKKIHMKMCLILNNY